MGVKSSENKARIKPIDLITKVLNKIDFTNLPFYAKLNIILTSILAVAAMSLVLPPILTLINQILYTVFAFVVSLCHNQNFTVDKNDSAALTCIVAFCSVTVEAIACMVFSYFAQKVNQKK